MDKPAGRIGLSLDDTEVTITIALGNPSHRMALAAFDEISRQFHTCGAIVLKAGDLEFTIDVTPRLKEQPGGSNAATDPGRTE